MNLTEYPQLKEATGYQEMNVNPSMINPVARILLVIDCKNPSMMLIEVLATAGMDSIVTRGSWPANKGAAGNRMVQVQTSEGNLG